jgi:hypothetical protein
MAARAPRDKDRPVVRAARGIAVLLDKVASRICTVARPAKQVRRIPQTLQYPAADPLALGDVTRTRHTAFRMALADVQAELQ